MQTFVTVVALLICTLNILDSIRDAKNEILTAIQQAKKEIITSRDARKESGKDNG